MSTTFISLIGSVYLASAPMSFAGCSPALTEQVTSAERIIDSLRPDKAGQMRVFATDGSEYTAGQANWLKGQLRGVLRACAQGDDASASSALRAMQELMNAHHRT